MTNNNFATNTPSVQVVSYAYEGNPVTFKVNGNVMINATKMARNFEEHKRPVFWLKLQSTREFLEKLSKVRNLTLEDLVQIKRGGANPGTWMHEDVALEFARWLSPAFAIWCNDRIKEILIGKFNQQTEQKAISDSFVEDLKNRIESIRKKTISSRDSYAKESGVNYSGITCDIIPFKWYEGESVEYNLNNLLIFFQNNTNSAYWALFQYLKCNRTLIEVRRDLQDLVNLVYRKYDIFTQS